MSDARIIQNLETVWSTIDCLSTPLSEEQWRLPTDCPGWTVKDLVAHMTGSECTLLGRPAPEHVPPLSGALPNAIAERNEVHVDYRRSQPGRMVLQEFREVTADRLRALRSLSEEEFSQRSWTPIGTGTYRDLMQMRIFDCYVHEQDIRRAIGQPGNLDGFPARHALRSAASLIARVLGERVELPEGTTVVFDVTGATSERWGYIAQGTGLHPLPQATDSPSAQLTLDFETFLPLVCGRMAPEGALVEQRVRIQGDPVLGREVLMHLNVLF